MISKEYLKKLYIDENKTQSEAATILGISQSQVCYLIRKYNLYKDKNRNKKNHKKHWTKEEVGILMEMYGIYSFESIAKKLGRSVESIENKRNRLKLGDSLEYTEYITAKELAAALGRTIKTIVKWIKEKGLQASYKTLAFKQKFYRIKVTEFWIWANKNQDIMRWDLYKRKSLGDEPKWLDAEIKKALKNKVVVRRWTKTDICYLISYYNNGMSYEDMSKNLNRTIPAIDRRLNILGIQRRQINVPWREEETEILREMRSKGYTFQSIADELGRALSLVQEKCKKYNIEKGKPNLPVYATV